MTPESPAPLTPTTPEERAVIRAKCEHEIVTSSRVLPLAKFIMRVLADLEWALERIAEAPCAPSCEALRRENCGLIPEATCRFVGPSGMRYEYCCIHARADCNCWKSEVRKR